MNQATQLTEIASIRLVGKVVVMAVWNSAPQPFLVGRAQCLDDWRVSFFAANGDGAANEAILH
jgi:hypothetical protein